MCPRAQIWTAFLYPVVRPCPLGLSVATLLAASSFLHLLQFPSFFVPPSLPSPISPSPPLLMGSIFLKHANTPTLPTLPVANLDLQSLLSLVPPILLLPGLLS